MRAQVVARLMDIGVIPVVRVHSDELALRISDALLAGGARTVEITFSVPGAPKVIAALRDKFPDLLVGAGTVLDEAAARAAVDAGAQYVVSPGFSPAVIRAAHRFGIPAMPGVLTPTEAVAALEAGADVLKLFPASTVGPSYLKALRAPLPQAIWCPSGGVDLDNMESWVKAGAHMVGVGSPLLGDAATGGDMGALTERTRRFMEAWARLRPAGGS